MHYITHCQVWTVMFNAMCPAELAAAGSYAYWEGALCSGTEAQRGRHVGPLNDWKSCFCLREFIPFYGRTIRVSELL